MQKKNSGVNRGIAEVEANTDLGSQLKSEVGERPRVEVRVLKANIDGKLEELSCYPLSYYGSCPNVGDTIVDGVMGDVTYYSIQRRYFVAENIYFSGWALIVREIEPAAPAMQLWQEWQDATDFWEEVAEQKREEVYESAMRSIEATTKNAALTKPPSKPAAKKRRKRVLKPQQP